MKLALSVREMAIADIEQITSYWLNAKKTDLEAMGVEPDKLPSRQQFETYLTTQIGLPIDQKESYCIIWLENGIPVGHSNTRPTVYGEKGFMHLHLWKTETRSKGSGYEFVKLTLPWFFKKLKLKEIFCEPYSLNTAPNKTIQKAGFELINEHTTIPGSFNFEQPVKLWRMSYERFKEIYQEV